MRKLIRRIGKEGRLTIPFELRKIMKLNEGDLLSISVEKGKIIVSKEKLSVGNAPEDNSAEAFLNALSPYERRHLLESLVGFAMKNS